MWFRTLEQVLLSTVNLLIGEKVDCTLTKQQQPAAASEIFFMQEKQQFF